MCVCERDRESRGREGRRKRGERDGRKGEGEGEVRGKWGRGKSSGKREVLAPGVPSLPLYCA